MTLLTKHHRRKLVKVIMGAEKERAGKLTDSQLVQEFMDKVFDGLESGSYEEALAEELVERFQAKKGVEVEDEQHSPSCWAMPSCTICGLTKKPWGRDAPPASANSYCDSDCEGYDQEPKPGHFWPNEKP